MPLHLMELCEFGWNKFHGENMMQRGFADSTNYQKQSHVQNYVSVYQLVRYQPLFFVLFRFKSYNFVIEN